LCVPHPIIDNYCVFRLLRFIIITIIIVVALVLVFLVLGLLLEIIATI
jgi:hypothetical protein